MKNKGFTLVELIAVVVIMGMILLIVFPATSRLMKSNEEKKYDSYYEAVQEQLELYARTRRDELGGINGKGCVDDKKLSDLKEYDYINEYKEEKDVTCLSPGDFTTDQLRALDIDVSRPYVNVRIENNEGNISLEYSMICVKNYNRPEEMVFKYSKLVEKTKTCENYVPVVTNSLLNVIKNSYSVTNAGNDSYVTGNPSNNYVWYSGKMWRIIGFNNTDRTIKLVTDDVVSIVNYNNNTTSSGTFYNNYSSSNIYLWLKNVFLPTLRNTDKYLLDVDWNYSNVAANVTSPITNGNTINSKIGMLNNYEYNTSKSFLNIGKNFWLISTTGSENAWFVNTSGDITSSNVSTFYGVRPSIVLKPNITYINGGNGTINNPYRLIGDIGANFGTNLNTRFPGEYVQVNGMIFRISSVDPRYTKLIGVNAITLDQATMNRTIAELDSHIVATDYNISASTIKYHYFDTKYSDNTFMGEYLKSWATGVEGKLVEGDFCRMKMLKTTSQTINCPQEDLINSKVALPKIGDMYAVGVNKEYWTINNSTDTKSYVVYSNNSLGEKGISEMSSILPVLVINNTVTITAGNGTLNSPYIIE